MDLVLILGWLGLQGLLLAWLVEDRRACRRRRRRARQYLDPVVHRR